MKNKDIPYMLSHTDSRFILEACPDNFNQRKKKINLKAMLIAACLCCLMVVLLLVLFIPFSTEPPKISKFKDSEYHKVISSINTLTFKKPKYKNNFDLLVSNVFSFLNSDAKGNSMTDGASPEFVATSDDATLVQGSTSSNSSSYGTEDSYHETTDNQVFGVTEADIFKRSDKYIFYLSGNTVRAYSILGSDSCMVGEYTVAIKIETPNKKQSSVIWNSKSELYLSNDCKTLTLILPYYTSGSGTKIEIISLDVESPESMKEKSRVTISGRYISSRMTKGQLLVISDYNVNTKAVDFDHPITFAPSIDTGNGMTPISGSDISVPENAGIARYTVLTLLTEGNLSLESNKAFFSYTDDVYVNNERIYLFNVFSEKNKNDTKDKMYTTRSMTDITCLSYDNELNTLGSTTVAGYVKDQYSLDELNGILRVVTTTNSLTLSENSSYTVSYSMLQTAIGESNASLYCIDISTWKVVASVVDFAPKGEEVMSVRFDGSYAYICTAIELSDPVYFFDLSDLSNITYKDSGTIDGFSSSLVNFGDGYLLGIGVDSDRSFKAEIYTEGSNSVNSVCKYIKKEVHFSENYKSYFIDRENKLLGLGFASHSEKNASSYVLLLFDGYELHELVNTKLDGLPEYFRAVLIDDYLYMISQNDFKIVKAL